MWPIVWPLACIMDFILRALKKMLSFRSAGCRPGRKNSPLCLRTVVRAQFEIRCKIAFPVFPVPEQVHLGCLSRRQPSSAGRCSIPLCLLPDLHRCSFSVTSALRVLRQERLSLPHPGFPSLGPIASLSASIPRDDSANGPRKVARNSRLRSFCDVPHHVNR